DDGADHPAARPDSQQPEDPAARNAANDTENDVHQYAIATALHDFPRKPARDQSNHNPCDKSHAILPKSGPAGRQKMYTSSRQAATLLADFFTRSTAALRS